MQPVPGSNSIIDMGKLAAWVRHRASGHPRAFVGIDGPGGSGKSTLARQLAAAFGGAGLVHVDDFYLPSLRRQERAATLGSLFDLPRLAEQVILPGMAGKPLRYQRYNWVQDALADWVDLPAGTPILVEGVYALSAELRARYTYTVWCRADPALRLARGLARDGEQARSTWVDVWMPAEDAYTERQHPERFADLVVDSSEESTGTPVFRVVRSS